MKLNKPYTNQEYAELASFCNNNNCHIEDKGNYLESETNENSQPEYVLHRMEAYPGIPEQLDMIYWDKINNTNLWQEKITEIKTTYPKA